MPTGVVHVRWLHLILEDLSEEFNGKLDVYKVNTEEEQELAAVFGIQKHSFILIRSGG